MRRLICLWSRVVAVICVVAAICVVPVIRVVARVVVLSHVGRWVGWTRDMGLGSVLVADSGVVKTDRFYPLTIGRLVCGSIVRPVTTKSSRHVEDCCGCLVLVFELVVDWQLRSEEFVVC